MNELVSIITPVYNSEKYIRETILSVQRQDYKNWELFLVDDCSSDLSADIIKSISNRDSRVKYVKLKENSGAAVARNEGLRLSKGRYIAYLDADDMWYPSKLSKQIQFMNDNNAIFSCCDYERIEEDGTPLNKVIRMPKKITYEQLLRNTIIQTVGVIVDLKYVDKDLLIMPNVRRGQDSATWLQMLRNGVEFKGQNEVLAQYRRAPRSLSANKFKAMQRTWNLYRNIEKLSVVKSLWCLTGWAYHASIKRLYPKKIMKK